MRWLLPLVLAYTTISCTLEKDPDSGTFVGNPGKLDVTVVDLQDDLVLDEASVAVESVRLYACDGSSGLYDLDATLDALQSDGIEIPGGDFCGAELTLANPGVRLAGQTTAGTDFVVFIYDTTVLQVGDDFRVDGTDVLWAFSVESLSAAAIDALGPSSVLINPGDPLSAEVAADAAQKVELYEDVDNNGLLDADDFLLGAYDPYGVGLDAAAQADAGCGCQTGPTPMAPALLLVALVTISRRKRTPGPVN